MQLCICRGAPKNIGINYFYLELHTALLSNLPHRCFVIMNIRTTMISGGYNRKVSEGMLLKNIDELQEQDD